MTRGKAEDAGGLTPAKDDNAAPYHFDRRTLPIFKCVDYIAWLHTVADWYGFLLRFPAGRGGACRGSDLIQHASARFSPAPGRWGGPPF